MVVVGMQKLFVKGLVESEKIEFLAEIKLEAIKKRYGRTERSFHRPLTLKSAMAELCISAPRAAAQVNGLLRISVARLETSTRAT